MIVRIELTDTEWGRVAEELEYSADCYEGTADDLEDDEDAAKENRFQASQFRRIACYLKTCLGLALERSQVRFSDN